MSDPTTNKPAQSLQAQQAISKRTQDTGELEEEYAPTPYTPPLQGIPVPPDVNARAMKEYEMRGYVATAAHGMNPGEKLEDFKQRMVDEAAALEKLQSESAAKTKELMNNRAKLEAARAKAAA